MTGVAEFYGLNIGSDEGCFSFFYVKVIIVPNFPYGPETKGNGLFLVEHIIIVIMTVDSLGICPIYGLDI